MIFKIIFTSGAEEDIQNAIDYYFSKAGQKVASDFYSDLNSSLDSIERNPYYQVRFKDFRVLPLRKFPYIIFFELFEDIKIVKIIAVFNTYQNSEKYP